MSKAILAALPGSWTASFDWGSALRRARYSMDLTQDGAAQLCGVDRRTILRIERGGSPSRAMEDELCGQFPSLSAEYRSHVARFVALETETPSREAGRSATTQEISASIENIPNPPTSEAIPAPSVSIVTNSVTRSIDSLL